MPLSDLQMIGGIVTDYPPKKIELLGPKHTAKGKMAPHWEAIALMAGGLAPDAKKYDRDAPDFMGMAWGSGSLRTFTYRLRQRIENTLLFVNADGTKASEAKKAEFECHTLLHQIFVLVSLYGRNPGIKMARKLYALAEKYGHTDCAVYASGILRKHFSETGHAKEFAKFRELNLFWMNRLQAEENAKSCLEQINVHFANHISQRPELARPAFENAKIVQAAHAQYGGYVLLYHCKRILAAAQQLAGQYHASIATWDTLKLWFDGNPQHASATRYAEIALNQLDCHLHLRQYEAGQQCANTCRQYFWPETRSYNRFLEFYYLLAMQSDDYKKAGEIIAELRHEKNKDYMAAAATEKWELFDAYQIYAMRAENETAVNRLSKITNYSPAAKKDKRGYNLTRLILIWCVLIRKKEFAKLMGIATAIKEYRLRYLKNSPENRVNLFVKMLQATEKHQFDTSAIIKATRRLHKKLSQEALLYDGNMEGLEIIPFEALWATVLGDMRDGASTEGQAFS